MAVDVSPVLSVISGMVPGVVAVGLAWLTVQAAIESFRYIRDALGYGAPDPNDPNDPRNYEHDVFAAMPGDVPSASSYSVAAAQFAQGAGPYAGGVEEDPYNNARVRAIHAENAWDPEWDDN